MRSLLHFLLLTVLAAQVMAEEATISSRYLSLTTGQNAGHLISQICDPLTDCHQLRAQRKAIAPMFGGKSEEERGGTRILWQEEGAIHTAEWQVAEQTDDTLQLISENAGATASISLATGESRFSLRLKWDEGSPLQRFPVLWEWLLEVGGDFFAVPTEGVADYQLLPVATKEGEHRLKVVPVERQSEGKETLAEPWWAVADRNRAVILVCRFSTPGNATAGAIGLDRKSGVQGSTDAFFQTMRLPSGRAGAPRELRASIMLFSHIQLFNALGDSTVWHLSERDGKLELQAATSRTIPGGEILLHSGDREVARWAFGEWTPEQPLSFSTAKGENLLSTGQKWTLEYRPHGGEMEMIAIYHEEGL